MPVILHTRTGVCRKHETFDAAWMWLREQDQNEKYLFCGPDDFERVSARGREVLLPRLRQWSQFRWGEDRVPQWGDFSPLDRVRQNQTLWNVVNKIADVVSISPPWLSGRTKQGNIVDLERCKELFLAKEWEMMDLHAPWAKARVRKPPPQLRGIVKELMINDNGFMNDAQLETLMRSLPAIMSVRSKQDSWRIFRYYRPILEQLKILR
jgi:hypothetical protein